MFSTMKICFETWNVLNFSPYLYNQFLKHHKENKFSKICFLSKNYQIYFQCDPWSMNLFALLQHLEIVLWFFMSVFLLKDKPLELHCISHALHHFPLNVLGNLHLNSKLSIQTQRENNRINLILEKSLDAT